MVGGRNRCGSSGGGRWKRWLAVLFPARSWLWFPVAHRLAYTAAAAAARRARDGAMGATGQRDRQRSDIAFSRQHRVATLLLVRAPCNVVRRPERNG